jgi:hypothetical protein
MKRLNGCTRFKQARVLQLRIRKIAKAFLIKIKKI